MKNSIEDIEDKSESISQNIDQTYKDENITSRYTVY